ncbi:MAG: recombinase family protein [Firmicutes bacterium]|nr:recombinase family protein [Bacillota bacterium]
MGRRDRIPKSTERYIERTRKKVWNTAVYARLSHENSGLDDSRSLQNQVRYVKEYIERRPELRLAGCYVDNGWSGMSFDRPEFKRLMDDVDAGKINCIAVKDLSRFGRNHVDAGYYIEKLFPKKGIRFISVNDGYDSIDDDGMNSIMVPIKNMVNEMYILDVRQKITNTIRLNHMRGVAGINLAPYGYLKMPGCSYRLIPDPETADYVRLMFKWTAAGVGVTETVRRLEALGAPTPLERKRQLGYKRERKTTGKWSNYTVGNMLKNRTYIGETVYNVYGKGEIMTFPDTRDALTDKDTFEAVREIRDYNSRRRKEAVDGKAEIRKQNPDVLNGLIFCAECGHAMLYSRVSRRGDVRRRSYICGNYYNYRRGDAGAPSCCAKARSVSDRTVRKILLGLIRCRMLVEADDGVIKSAAYEAKMNKRAETELLLAEETNIKNGLHRLYEDFADKKSVGDDYAEAREAYLERLREVRERLAEIEEDTVTDPCDALKLALFDGAGGSRQEGGTVMLAPHSSVEIIEADEKNDAERLLCAGLTRGLAEAMVERVEYGVGGYLSVTFGLEDYAERLIRDCVTEAKENQ